MSGLLANYYYTIIQARRNEYTCILTSNKCKEYQLYCYIKMKKILAIYVLYFLKLLFKNLQRGPLINAIIKWQLIRTLNYLLTIIGDGIIFYNI